MFCGKCGKELGEDTAFCPGCGAAVERSAEAAAGAENAAQAVPSAGQGTDAGAPVAVEYGMPLDGAAGYAAARGKKKKKGWIAALVIGLAVVLVAGVVGGTLLAKRMDPLRERSGVSVEYSEAISDEIGNAAVEVFNFAAGLLKDKDFKDYDGYVNKYVDNDSFSNSVQCYYDQVNDQDSLVFNKAEKRLHNLTVELTFKLQAGEYYLSNAAREGDSLAERQKYHNNFYTSIKKKVLAIGEYLS